jgi:nitroreductase
MPTYGRQWDAASGPRLSFISARICAIRACLMETLEVIRRRRAVRDYKPDPVSKDALEQIVVAASWAPSAMNAQPWRFTIVTDRQLMSDISDRAKRFMIESVDALPQPDHFRDLMQNPDFDLFYNAPVLLVIRRPENSAGALRIVHWRRKTPCWQRPIWDWRVAGSALRRIG